MEFRTLMMRAPAVLRQLQTRSTGASLVFARHESYQSSVNQQPPLSKPFTGVKVDLNQGPYGPLDPKVKQLQEFYQTDTGRHIWQKTALDDILFKIAFVGTFVGFGYSLYSMWGLINPTPVKKD